MGKRGPKPIPPIIRMFDKFTIDEGCWLWTASVNAGGYGRIGMPIGDKNKDPWRVAHRVLWEYFNGPVPNGLELDHLCRNRRCVKPSHLEAITRQENALRGDTGAHWAAKRSAKVVI